MKPFVITTNFFTGLTLSTFSSFTNCLNWWSKCTSFSYPLPTEQTYFIPTEQTYFNELQEKITNIECTLLDSPPLTPIGIVDHVCNNRRGAHSDYTDRIHGLNWHLSSIQVRHIKYKSGIRCIQNPIYNILDNPINEQRVKTAMLNINTKEGADALCSTLDIINDTLGTLSEGIRSINEESFTTLSTLLELNEVMAKLNDMDKNYLDTDNRSYLVLKEEADELFDQLEVNVQGLVGWFEQDDKSPVPMADLAKIISNALGWY